MNEYKSNVPFLGMIGREDRKEENKSLLAQLKDIENGGSGDVKIDPPVSDFVMRGNTVTPFRKDDLIIGGTKLMDSKSNNAATQNIDKSNDEVIKLLMEINKHLSEGKSIFLDGQKVGNSLIKGSYQVA